MWPFTRKAPATATTATGTAFGAATSLRSWEYAFRTQFGQYVPLTVNYELYDVIREGIPFVDTALRKLARMVSGFHVKSENEAAAEQVNEWLFGVRTFGICNGFDTLEASYVNSLLQYGKACAEVVLSASGRDIYQITTVPITQLKLITADTGALLLGEDSNGVAKAYDRQELFAYSAMNVQGDNPHGSSILRSLPFTTNTMLVMENALRQRWMRHGAPGFVFVEELDPTLSVSATDISARQASWSNDWKAAMRDRWNENGIRDFFAITQGKLRIETAEPRLQPDYAEPLRSLEEQIVSSTELAPFMLGLQWSTTERLSQQQADAILGLVYTIRDEVGPAYMSIVDTWCRLHGISAVMEPQWPDVNLQDAVQTADAELKQAQALESRQRSAITAWRNGWRTQLQAAQDAGYEVESEADLALQLEAPVGAVAAPAAAPPGSPDATQPQEAALALIGGTERVAASWKKYPS